MFTYVHKSLSLLLPNTDQYIRARCVAQCHTLPPQQKGLRPHNYCLPVLQRAHLFAKVTMGFTAAAEP
jgi:dihydroorotase